MKKVMIGILILIPIIILLVVAMVSTIVSAQAHVAVENIELKYKDSESTIYELSLTLEEVANKTINLKDYLDVVVYPQKANNYTIEWTISGDVTYTDDEYYDLYKKYLEDPDSYERVYPAAAFVDEGGREVASNTSGDLMIGSYCTFTVRVVAENVSKILSVKVVGYDVKRVELRAQIGNGTLEVGESVRLLASYTPIDSIVSKTEWTSSDPAVATVDKNGVVTAKSQGVATITHGASVYSTGENVEGFIQAVAELMPEGPMWFPADMDTDQSIEVIVAEFIREKILRSFFDEVPHAVGVAVEEMEYVKKSDLERIYATIYVEHDSQKGIIIGKKGSALKRIGTEARNDLEQFLGSKVFLDLRVKVRKNWRRDLNQIRRFGYGEGI